MAVTAVRNISYAPPTSPFRQFDLYHIRPIASGPIICFVHGGAWRSEDKAEYADLAARLCRNTKLPVAVPNYRLTQKGSGSSQTDFKHPGHAEDILTFLSFLRTWSGPDTTPDKGPALDLKFYLMGHSCAAHMLSAIILDSSSITPSLTPEQPLLEAVQGIILSEGIFDIDLLLSAFPNYREWFIASAFGALDSYAQYSVTNYNLRASAARWLLIHSKGDTLVDLPQCQAMLANLRKIYGKMSLSHVKAEMDRLDGGHNDVLHTDVYADIVAEFINKDLEQIN